MTVEHVGGSPANVAFGLAALDHPVDLATWIATDERGNRIEAVCRERGVRADARVAGRPVHLRRPRDPRRHRRGDLRLRPRLAARRRPRTSRHTAMCTPAASPRCSSPAATTCEPRWLRLARPDGHRSPTTPTPGRASWAPRPTRVALIEEAIALADVVKLSDEDVEWLLPRRAVDDVIAALGQRSGPPCSSSPAAAQGGRPGCTPDRRGAGAAGAPRRRRRHGRGRRLLHGRPRVRVCSTRACSGARQRATGSGVPTSTTSHPRVAPGPAHRGTHGRAGRGPCSPTGRPARAR